MYDRRLTIADLEKENMYMKKNEELNYPQYIAAQRDIEEWASRGLMNRAVIVRSQYLNNSTWSLTEVRFLHSFNSRTIQNLIISFFVSHSILITSLVSLIVVLKLEHLKWTHG